MLLLLHHIDGCISDMYSIVQYSYLPVMEINNISHVLVVNVMYQHLRVLILLYVLQKYVSSQTLRIMDCCSGPLTPN